MFKVGDKVFNNKTQTEYIITNYDSMNNSYQIQFTNTAVFWSMWISYNDLCKCYTVVNSNNTSSNNSSDDDDQLYFGDYYHNDSLPKGKMNTSNECYHNWQVYTGLNFTDEFCTKCNAKREYKP